MPISAIIKAVQLRYYIPEGNHKILPSNLDEPFETNYELLILMTKPMSRGPKSASKLLNLTQAILVPLEGREELKLKIIPRGRVPVIAISNVQTKFHL